MEFNWLELAGKIFEVILLPIISAAGVYLAKWFKAKKEEIAEKVTDEKTKKYLEILNDTIASCVAATNQTFVGSLKASGSFDEAAQKEAFQRTVDAVKGILTEEVKKHLGTIVGDLGAFIAAKIEANINDSKE